MENSNPFKNTNNSGGIEREKAKIKADIQNLDNEIIEILETSLPEDKKMSEISHSDTEKILAESQRAERMLADVLEKVEQENFKRYIYKTEEIESTTKDNFTKKRIGVFLKNAKEALKSAGRAATKTKLRVAMSTLLPISAAIYAVSSREAVQEYYEMAQNWMERHVEREDMDDPSIKGVGDLYADSVDVERTTYDFLGEQKIDYKSGYYKTSVFDLSDSTPPKFEMINDRENYNDINDVAGITTNLFENFRNFNEFEPQLKGHENKNHEEKLEIPVVGYNTKTQTMRAGHYKEFNEDWMVSETYEIPLNFKLNEDGTVNLTYPHSTLRMVPMTTNENGVEIPFPIGITRDKAITKFDPHEATSFGVLEGGKVIMVCGDKQLQVNGSFADMFRVYERLQKEYPGVPISGYLLDNGSYNLPIWNKDNVLTKAEIKEHMLRNKGGGTALVLKNEKFISPYEYKNKYPEFQHLIEGRLDENTGEPLINEHSVVILHHTGNYADPNQIIKDFENPENERSAHVIIFKDGTRHIFNDDESVLAHAGKSVFNEREKVNLFSLGIELEGDSIDGRQFTLAQLESLLEYLRPRIEKYNIPLENITDHETIRNNWFLAHPDRLDDEGKEVQGKRDLDDKVFEQIQELIQKKIYEKKQIKLNTETGKLVGAITYQDEYRKTRDGEVSLKISGQMLKDFGMLNADVERVQNYIRNFT